MISCFDRSSDVMSPKSPVRKQFMEGASSPRKSPKKAMRHLPTAPSKILDAPDLMDDYYLNLLSWGPNNRIAVALNDSVYIWNPADESVDRLVTLEGEDYVSSVQFCTHGADDILAVGTSSNKVQIYDTSRLQKIRDMDGHTARVSSLAWNGHMLSSGGRDSAILHHDIRQHRHLQSTYLGHQQEVCGLAWSPDGTTLASGGNENTLCIWDGAMMGGPGSRSSSGSGYGASSRRLSSSSSTPRFRLEQHQAAVKALAWCPFKRNVLASGGGTADRTIRLWNASSGANLSVIDTGSQVCAMQWSETHRELVSSHGFSDNQLCLWKLTAGDNLLKLKEFRGHTARVLHMAKSPDGKSIITAGADETLRFWDIFASSVGSTTKTKTNAPGPSLSLGSLGGMVLR